MIFKLWISFHFGVLLYYLYFAKGEKKISIEIEIIFTFKGIHLNSFPFLSFAPLVWSRRVVRANYFQKKLKENFPITFMPNFWCFAFCPNNESHFIALNFSFSSEFSSFFFCHQNGKVDKVNISKTILFKMWFLINVCSNGFCGFRFVWNECSVNLISGDKTKHHNSKFKIRNHDLIFIRALSSALKIQHSAMLLDEDEFVSNDLIVQCSSFQVFWNFF